MAYTAELQQLPEFWQWAMSLEEKALRRLFARIGSGPLLVVGSGGSYASCSFLARLHQHATGSLALAITPLEYIRSPRVKAAVLLVSASGRNPDIQAAAEHALRAEVGPVAGLCLREDSPLVRTLLTANPDSVYFADPPHGKDGFLATGSLLATMIMMCRAWKGTPPPAQLPVFESSAKCHLEDAAALEHRSLIVLCSGWSGSAGLDLESRWGEAGLGAVTVLDPRNFAHGRHQGLARLVADSAVLSFETPADVEILHSTLSLLPSEIKVARIRSPLDGAWGAVDLVVRSMWLANQGAQIKGFDPARPGVPEFGRKLYHQKLPRSVVVKAASGPELWLRRKIPSNMWDEAESDQRQAWVSVVEQWATNFENTCFGGVVFDYDGTLCDATYRFEDDLRAEVKASLDSLLRKGLNIGVATGRGKSVPKALRRVFSEELWPKITVGIYNGGALFGLDEDIPVLQQNKLLAEAALAISMSPLKHAGYKIELSALQITVGAGERCANTGEIRRLVLQVLRDANLPESHFHLVSSDHSLDIVPQASSKNHVVAAIASCVGVPTDRVMRIGDQGDQGGNDYDLLAHPCGLSVDRVSPSLTGCWNVAAPGRSGVAALLTYINAFRCTSEGAFTFGIGSFQ